jgi:hypothetical protein
MQSRTPDGTTSLDYLRLLVGATSAALASLAVVEARSWPMVVLTLGATEWGHVLAAFALTPLLPGRRRTRWGCWARRSRSCRCYALPGWRCGCRQQWRPRLAMRRHE